jgi:DHA1 family inner membrane transport protein
MAKAGQDGTSCAGAWSRGRASTGGKAADRNIDRTLLVVLAVLSAILVFFALTATSQVLTVASLVLMGGFGFATVPGLQMRVMTYASSAPTLASGANIGAFNVGNALGAWLGGVTITAGLGYTSPIWAGAGLTLLGLAVMAFAAAAAKRSSGLGAAGAASHQGGLELAGHNRS